MKTLLNISKSIIEAYERGLFNQMLQEYESLTSENKRHFINYCESEGLESVPLTILEYQTYKQA